MEVPDRARLQYRASARRLPDYGRDKRGLPVTRPAVFLFSTEDGRIHVWNPGVYPVGFDPAKAGTYAIIAVTTAGAIYKGLAITNAGGTPLLYVTNFHAGTVEVYNASFGSASPTLPPGAFVDPKLPRGYAPFNIVPIGARMFVTYAVQDADKKDDVRGQSHGIVDTFTLDGQMLARFAQHGQLNSPWGVALAPASFGAFAGDILIGNFGNGHINIYDPTAANSSTSCGIRMAKRS
jgi:uncharacterized protein (TIGR03118 family)